MSTIERVQVVPSPDGYFLEVTMSDGISAAFQFTNAQQVADFSKDCRAVALLSAGFEELRIGVEDLQVGDRIHGLPTSVIYPPPKGATEAASRLVIFGTNEAKASTSLYLAPDIDHLTVIRSIE